MQKKRIALGPFLEMCLNVCVLYVCVCGCDGQQTSEHPINLMVSRRPPSSPSRCLRNYAYGKASFMVELGTYMMDDDRYT